MNYEEMKWTIESLTGDKNTLLLDESGKPSVMVKIPKQTYASLGIGSSQKTHPAFIVNGVEKEYIYVSKYQNIIEEGRAYSLPGKDPAGGNVDFETARKASEVKGRGWHLMTNAEWAAVALWCKANGKLPRGNTMFGHSHAAVWEGAATGMRGEDGQTNRCISGSGPVSWAHNYAEDGIYDMAGNIWEWMAGARLLDGEIQVIKDNDAAAGGVDFSENSRLWKAVTEDGSLVEPGSKGTLKWDYTEEPKAATASFCLSTDITHQQKDNTAFGVKEFGKVTSGNGVIVPDLLKALALFPEGVGYEEANFWVRNLGERFMLRGGCWTRGKEAGIFALNMFGDRFHIAEAVGFRACYTEPQ